MSQYGLLPAIVMSFYSKKLYRDVAFNWGGKAFLYLLLVLFLSWICFAFQVQIALNNAYATYSEKISSQVPILTIKDGVLSTPEAKPYIIKLPDSDKNLAVIDTTGQYANLSQAQSEILVTKTDIITQSKANEIRTDKLPQTLNMVIEPESTRVWIGKYLYFFWIPLFLMVWIASYVYRIIQALIYGIIGKIFSVMVDAPLSYPHIVQIAMVAVTPAIVISTVLDFMAITVPYEFLLYFLLTMFYLLLGVYANKPNLPIKRQEVIISEPPKENL